MANGGRCHKPLKSLVKYYLFTKRAIFNYRYLQLYEYGFGIFQGYPLAESCIYCHYTITFPFFCCFTFCHGRSVQFSNSANHALVNAALPGIVVYCGRRIHH